MQPNSVQTFLDDLGSHPRLAPDENERLGHQITAGRSIELHVKSGKFKCFVLTPEAEQIAHRLFMGNLLIAAAWATHRKEWGGIDDHHRSAMIMVGLDGLKKGAQHWDPAQGCPFAHWVYIKADGQLTRVRGKNTFENQYADRKRYSLDVDSNPDHGTYYVSSLEREITEHAGNPLDTTEDRSDAIDQLDVLYKKLLQWFHLQRLQRETKQRNALLLSRSLGLDMPLTGAQQKNKDIAAQFGITRATCRLGIIQGTKDLCQYLSIPFGAIDRRNVLRDLVKSRRGYSDNVTNPLPLFIQP